MNTPFFPPFRSRLAALGRRTVGSLRQATLGQLQDQIRDVLPAPLLSSEEDGPNSRERDFPLRLTFECFLWQMLKPRTACREVVRHVQALRTLHGLPPISEDDSAYIQARLRLPRERLDKSPGGHRPNRRSPGRPKPPTPRPSRQGRGRLLDAIGRHARQPTALPSARFAKAGLWLPLDEIGGDLLPVQRGGSPSHPRQPPSP